MIEPRFDQIPAALREKRNWVVWRVVTRVNKSGEVKKTKPPFNARTGKLAKTNDPSTWSSHEEAKLALQTGHGGKRYDGAGVCLSDRDVGIDLDGCVLPDGSIEPEAQRIIAELSSYTELSPSGTGIRILATGELPPGRRRKNFLDREHHGVEMYDHTSPRFLTITGQRISGDGIIAERTEELSKIHARLFPPPQPKTEVKPMKATAMNDDDLLDRAIKANDNGKFARLWVGAWKGEYPSESEADLALCVKLCFWTNHDAGRMDALYRRSGLMREKWNREDYAKRTIQKALELQTASIGQWQPPAPTVTLQASKVAATVETLNAMPLFAGLQFTQVERRGHVIVASFADGSEVVWGTMKDLTGFSPSQALLAEATGIVIPSPSRNRQKATWEPIAQLILRIAGGQRVTAAQQLREEFGEILFNVWKRADGPIAQDKAGFVKLLQECLKHSRNSKATAPPRYAIWHDTSKSYVHLATLTEWLSVPSGKHHRYDAELVERALRLLGFVPLQVHKSHKEVGSAKVRLWVGSLDVLTEDLTPDAGDTEIEEEL